MSATQKPDTFIVGAPKCGTSAMWSFLKQHPEIYMSEQKEIYNFFGSDLKYHIPKLREKEYLAHFKFTGAYKRVGEATVFHLVSRNAAMEIQEFNPKAKIILMLRNPIEMAYALYGEQVYNGNEKVDFITALKDETARLNGKLNVKNMSFPDESLCYKYMATYTPQVQRYLEVFGPDHVHVIIYDDFQSKLPEVYRSTLKFLGVDTGFQPEFEKVNPSMKVRSNLFRDFLKHFPEGLKTISRIIIPNKPLRKKLFFALHQVNTKHEERTPLPSQIELELKQFFRPDIEALGKLIGRDLMHWVNK